MFYNNENHIMWKAGELMSRSRSKEKYENAMKEYILSDTTICSVASKYGISTAHFSKFLKANNVGNKKESERQKKYEMATQEYVEQSLSISKLAEKYEVSAQGLSNYIKANGIEIRRRKSGFKERYEVAMVEYKKGVYTINQLCEKHKISAQGFSKFLRKNGVKVLNKSERSIEKYIKAMDEYINGDISISKICDKYRIHRETFSNFLKSKNVSIKYNIGLENSRDNYSIAIKEYIDGDISIVKLAKKYGTSRTHLAEYIKENNIIVENKQNVIRMNKNAFEDIDTEEKAYWLGFLYADGYVGTYRNEVGLALKESDYSHLVKYKRFIEYMGEIVYSKRTKSYKIQFLNKKMRADLIEKGCTSRKSKTLEFPSFDKVPRELMKHFIRGYIDGDGYVGIENPYYGRLSIIGTESILQGIIDTMGFKCVSIRKANKEGANEVKVVEWKGIYVIDYLRVLYENANIYLERKYKVYEELEEKYSKRNESEKKTRVYPVIPIIQMDNNSQCIKIWNSISEAEKTLNIDKSSIIRVCKKRQQTAGGYKWRYLRES